MRSLRSRVTAVLGGVLLACSAATVAGAQEPPPTVTTAGLDGAFQTVTDCDGETTTSVNAAMVAIRRSGDTADELSVDVTYGGTLDPGVDYDAPDPVVVAAGDESTLLFIEPDRPGTVTLTIDAGTGYLVGDPATTTVEVPLLQIVPDCVPIGEEVQTIEVGTAPEPIDVYGEFGSYLADGNLIIDGQVPPGLTFRSDGSWDGTATEVGTFDFVARYCAGPDDALICPLELPVRIIVVPVGDGPTSPPATPIPTPARFTG